MARQVLDSRGNPTVKVDVLTENGRKAVPVLEASTGSRGTLERDGNKITFVENQLKMLWTTLII
ncbi:MAG: hypothetical protein U0T83_01285 [Bacteriovoracaceae bacterium]